MATPNLQAITSVVPGVLASAQMASGVNTVYTVPASKAVQMGALVLCNRGASAVTVNAGLVPSGGTADGTHDVVFGLSIAPNETVILDEFAAIKWAGAGDAILVNVSAAASVNATLAGLVMS